MTALHALWERLKMLRHRRQLDADLREELEHHRALAAAQGRTSLGSAAYWHEETRREWTFPRLEAWLSDLRYAFRRLRQDRAFSLVALVTLALGIGATTAVFSLLNSLLWRPLPIPHPERLIRLALTHLPPNERLWLDGRPIPARERVAVSYAMFQALQRHTDVLDGHFALAGSGTIHVESAGAPYEVRFGIASGGIFESLELKPQAGRFFQTSDDRRGGPNGSAWPAVISDDLWLRLFQRSPQAIGATITADQIPFVITGVLPPEFKGLNPGAQYDLWLPLHSMESLYPLTKWFDDPSVSRLRPFARLKPGVTFAQAQQYLANLGPSLLAESVDHQLTGDRRRYHLAMHVEPREGGNGFTYLTETYAGPLTLMMGAVGAVLLIAATNLASLFLARAIARRPELAVRVALGAPAGRLRRELLLESLLLSLGGTLAGYCLGQWLAHGLLRLASGDDNQLLLDTSFDLRLFAFLAAILLLVTLIAGFGSALHAGRTPAYAPLRATGASRFAFRLRGALLIGQTGLSLALAGGAGLMLTSLQSLVNESTGYDAEHTVFLGPDLFNAGISRERMPRAYENILRDLRLMPEIAAAGLTDLVPLSGSLNRSRLDLPGRPDLAPAQRDVFLTLASDGYLAAAGIPLLAGHDLPPAGSPRQNEVIASDSAARRFYGSPAAALGQTVRLEGQNLTIVGVAADSKYAYVRESHPPTLYLPYWTNGVRPGWRFALRTRGSLQPAIAAATRIMEREAGRLPFITVRTIDQNVRGALSRERLITWLLGAMAVLALAISATGLGGLLSYLVEERRRDFGIRLALGATSTQVQALVLRHALLLTAGGITLGAALAYTLRRSLDAFVYDVTASDPRIWFFGVALLLAAVLLAAFGPLRRIQRLDPARLLRSD